MTEEAVYQWRENKVSATIAETQYRPKYAFIRTFKWTEKCHRYIPCRSVM